MSHEQNITTVKEIYDAVARGDVDAILDRVTDDVDWAAEAAGSAAPWYGQRSGKDGAGSFFGDLASSIEITKFEPAQLRRRRRRCPPARGLGVPIDRHRPRSINDHAPLLAAARRQGRVLPRQRRHRS